MVVLFCLREVRNLCSRRTGRREGILTIPDAGRSSKIFYFSVFFTPSFLSRILPRWRSRDFTMGIFNDYNIIIIIIIYYIDCQFWWKHVFVSCLPKKLKFSILQQDRFFNTPVFFVLIRNWLIFTQNLFSYIV